MGLKQYIGAAFPFVLSIVPHANAGVLYNNIGAQAYFEDHITDTGAQAFGPLYASFSTGAYTSMLTDLQLRLGVGDPADGGSFTVSLLSNAGLNPGGMLASLGTVLDSTLSPAQSSVIDIRIGTPIALAADTRYWIELSSDNTSATWAYSFDLSGAGVAGEYYDNADGVYPNNSSEWPGAYQMSVTAVPEPLSVALFLSGLVGIGVVRRRNSG
jgi:hypothetical protein